MAYDDRLGLSYLHSGKTKDSFQTSGLHHKAGTEDSPGYGDVATNSFHATGRVAFLRNPSGSLFLAISRPLTEFA